MLKFLLRGKTKAKRVEKRAVRRELLAIDGADVAVNVRLNPRARRIVMRVIPITGEVTVTAPAAAAAWPRRWLSRAAKPQWIARQLATHAQAGGADAGRGGAVPGRQPSHPRTACRAAPRRSGRRTARSWSADAREHAPRRLADFFKREARKAFEATRALEYAARLGVKPSRITVRDTASRWGSCSSARLAVLFLAADFRARLRARLCGGA